MKITRSQLKKVIKEEVAYYKILQGQLDLNYIAEAQDHDNKRMGKWWQQPKKRKIVIESYTKGENKNAIINKLRRVYFKSGTTASIINEYYNEFVLPQVIIIIESTWVTKVETPEGEGIDNAGAWYDPEQEEIQLPTKKITGRKVMQTLSVIIGSLAGSPLTGGLIAGWLELFQRHDWRKNGFGHELAHAINMNIKIEAGFRWELGYQNPKDIYTKTAKPVLNPKYLPHLSDDAPPVGKPVAPGGRGEAYSDRHNIPGLLLSIFPCVKKGHPEHKSGNHAYSWHELLSNITQARTILNREFTADDVMKIRKGRRLSATSGKKLSNLIVTDLKVIFNDCETDKSDSDIADALNDAIG